MISIARVLATGLAMAALANPAFAGKYDRKGTLTLNNVNIPGCGTVQSVNVKYSVGTFMGEPTRNGLFKWNAGSESAQRCINYSTSIYLKVQGQNGGGGYIKVSPSVPKSGKGFGFNTTGSPNWNAFICDSGGGNCLSANDAKNLIKSGYSVTGFRVYTRDIPKAKPRPRSSSTSTTRSSRTPNVFAPTVTTRRNMPTVVAPVVTTRSTTTRSRTNYKPRPTLKRSQFGKGQLRTEPKTLSRTPGKVYYSKNRARTNTRTTATRRTTTKRYATKPRTSTRTTATRRTTAKRYVSKPRTNTRTTATRRTTTKRYVSKPRTNTRTTATRRTTTKRYVSKPRTSSNRSSSRRRCPYGQYRC